MAGAELPVRSFRDRDELHAWLDKHHESSDGLWVRLFKAGSGVATVSFTDLLEEGLCFGWSESTRRAGDAHSYLQRFTPRRRVGTVSPRNERLVQRLTAEGRMTTAGLRALGRYRPAPPRPVGGAPSTEPQQM